MLEHGQRRRGPSQGFLQGDPVEHTTKALDPASPISTTCAYAIQVAPTRSDGCHFSIDIAIRVLFDSVLGLPVGVVNDRAGVSKEEKSRVADGPLRPAVGRPRSFSLAIEVRRICQHGAKGELFDISVDMVTLNLHPKLIMQRLERIVFDRRFIN